MSLIAVHAGLGSPSSTRMLADRLVSAVCRADPDRVDREQVELVALRDIAQELLNTELSHVPTLAVQHLTEAIQQADGLIAVTPVFNAQPAAIFSLLFEVLDEGALRGKPVLLGATGGTARHSLVLDRAIVPMFHYLHAVVSPVSVFAATDDWAGTALERRCQEAATAFLTLLGHRPAPGPGVALSPSTAQDDFTLDEDFETMMRRISGGKTSGRPQD